MSASPRPASLARRALPALVLTGAAAGLVTRLDHPASATGTAAPVTGSAAPVTSGSTATGAAGTTGTSPAGTTATSQAPSTSGSRTSGGGVTTTVPSTSGSCTGQTLAGPAESTRWGTVQVQAIVSSSGQLCDVQALQYPNDHGRSVQINQYALPILEQRAVAANGASFQAVSGATVTSEGYRASLQAILDKVR